MNTQKTELTAEEIIKLLNLEPHPEEGGFFVEVYRSTQDIPAEVLQGRVSDPRSLATSIFYLLTPATFSSMHRLKFDEVFHFYIGDPVTMINLYPDGHSETVMLGSDIRQGQRLQHVVPQDVWQGSFLAAGGQFALMGTTVSPGFDFLDYEAGNADDLCGQFPQSADLIRRLVR